MRQVFEQCWRLRRTYRVPGNGSESASGALSVAQRVECLSALKHPSFLRCTVRLRATFDTNAPYSRMRSAAFSAIASMGRLVLPLITMGMIDPSTTRSMPIPRTRRRASTTASGSSPMRQVPTGW